MIIEPGNALETYHPVRIQLMRCPVSRLAGTHAGAAGAHSLPEQRANWRRILERVPPITTGTKAGQTIIAYAESNVRAP
ncbi:MAG: hypothetical protein IPK17_00160 [Chloroflexi bacterium]|uniref:hypothetical protein n=1 Tax=Candidatus Flexifilum breve TaxID=3140694 RepID=UPI0031376813|nr:hypothetical protein [Chloroflexota bacterium]